MQTTGIEKSGHTELVSKIRSLRLSKENTFDATLVDMGNPGSARNNTAKTMAKASRNDSFSNNEKFKSSGRPERSFSEVREDNRSINAEREGLATKSQKEPVRADRPDARSSPLLISNENGSKGLSRADARVDKGSHIANAVAQNNSVKVSAGSHIANAVAQNNSIKVNADTPRVASTEILAGNQDLSSGVSVKDVTSGKSLNSPVVASIITAEVARLPLFKTKLALNMEEKTLASSPKVDPDSKIGSEPVQRAVKDTGKSANTATANVVTEGEKVASNARVATGGLSVTDDASAVKAGNMTGVQDVGNQVGVLGGFDKTISVPTVQSSAYSSIAERVNQVQDILSKAGGSIMKLVKGGGGKMFLRLDPPSMGRMIVEVEILKGVCNARVLAEDSGVKAALLQGLPQLREALESNGLKLEGFTVDSRWQMGANDRGDFDKWGGDARSGYGNSGKAEVSQTAVKSDANKVNVRPILGTIDLHV